VKLEEILQQYPTKRIKPVDGMAVTSEVWEEAHAYHRQRHGLHVLFSQGSGILAGLEVIASDPPDTSVYILPGVAVDPAGQTIVLPQPVSYDIGHEMDGALYLLLSYGESQPRTDNGSDEEGNPLYVHTEFSIFARTSLPGTSWVELARVRRDSREAVFQNAQNPAYPEANEIDLRYRREIGAPREASLAVAYLGQLAGNNHGRGVSYLAQSLNHTGRFQVSVEDGVSIGPSIITNTLIYLVGQGRFELEAGLMNGLRNYVHRGKGTLFIESMDAAAEESFFSFLKATGMQPEPLPDGHRLLTHPYLFAAPPPGFGNQGTPKLLFGEGVIYSTYNYGLLWQGEQRGRKASREEIRSAMEWGGNIIAYAMERRR
jgi:hypothetical protein